jgi:hypothetical protein
MARIPFEQLQDTIAAAFMRAGMPKKKRARAPASTPSPAATASIRTD